MQLSVNLNIVSRIIPIKWNSFLLFTRIYGIGPRLSVKIVSFLGVNYSFFLNRIPTYHYIFKKLRFFFFKINLKIENNLRNLIDDDIEYLKKIGTRRGNRFFKGFPNRGQRTHSNAMTCKRLLESYEQRLRKLKRKF